MLALSRVRPSTLRHWDAEGLAVPRRASPRGPRRYFPDDVRDARIVHQLRMAGYRIAPLQALMPELRRTNRWEEVMTTLAARDASIDARSRALLDGAAVLTDPIDESYLSRACRGHTGVTPCRRYSPHRRCTSLPRSARAPRQPARTLIRDLKHGRSSVSTT
jgi:DNA-binding transcriptional MerR regulator